MVGAPVVGVPVRLPEEESVAQEGRPVAANVTDVPVAPTAKLIAWPTVPVVLAALVNEGGWPTTIVQPSLVDPAALVAVTVIG
ncbi:MAG: hypothetical protein M0007_00170 [Actinomycetota bacterium]|nr:hypothetical protein [Actinomycetota bacterium]